MKQAQPDAKEMMAEIGREPGRSTLFWDFYDNHAAMLRAKGVGRFHWRKLTARVIVRGLTDANGNAPDQETTKKTWHRVCQLKAREQAAREKQQRTRNREPERGVNADRPPPVVTAPAPRLPVPHYPPPPLPTMPVQGTADQRPHSELSQEERRARTNANVLRLRRRFAETSGRDPDEIE